VNEPLWCGDGRRCDEGGEGALEWYVCGIEEGFAVFAAAMTLTALCGFGRSSFAERESASGVWVVVCAIGRCKM